MQYKLVLCYFSSLSLSLQEESGHSLRPEEAIPKAFGLEAATQRAILCFHILIRLLESKVLRIL